MFQPPRNKTEVLKPVTFIGPARVLSSVVDQDSYTGFVGVQDKVSYILHVVVRWAVFRLQDI